MYVCKSNLHTNGLCDAAKKVFVSICLFLRFLSWSALFVSVSIHWIMIVGLTEESN